MLDVDIFIHKSQHPLSKNYKVWKVEKGKHGTSGKNNLFENHFYSKTKQKLDGVFVKLKAYQRFQCWGH